MLGKANLISIEVIKWGVLPNKTKRIAEWLEANSEKTILKIKYSGDEAVIIFQK